MRDRTLLISVSALHILASFGLLFYTIGAGMARFDNPAPPAMSETIAQGLFALLSFPILTAVGVLQLRVPGLLGYIPFLANASLWGLAAVMINRRRGRT